MCNRRGGGGGRKEKRKGQRKRERGGGRTRGQKNGHLYFIENISQSDEFEGSNIYRGLSAQEGFQSTLKSRVRQLSYQ